jgi:hypothetical protein
VLILWAVTCALHFYINFREIMLGCITHLPVSFKQSEGADLFVIGDLFDRYFNSSGAVI